MSSPEMQAPTLRLRSEIFTSPARKPGVSVLESRPRPTPRGERHVARAPSQRARGEWSSSDEDDTDQDDKGGYRGGMDPPSRIKIDYDQPEERIFRTPGRSSHSALLPCPSTLISRPAFISTSPAQSPQRPSTSRLDAFTSVELTSRLITERTPHDHMTDILIPAAREASRKMVDDILHSAGGSANDEADPVKGEDFDDFEIDMTVGADGAVGGDGDGDLTSQVINTRDRAGKYGPEGGGGGRGQGRQIDS